MDNMGSACTKVEPMRCAGRSLRVQRCDDVDTMKRFTGCLDDIDVEMCKRQLTTEHALFIGHARLLVPGKDVWIANHFRGDLNVDCTATLALQNGDAAPALKQVVHQIQQNALIQNS